MALPLLAHAPGEHVFVRVSGVPVNAEIGAHHHEVGRRQRLNVSVELEIDPPAADRVQSTFDYDRVSILLERIGSEHTTLLETFARKVARALSASDGVRRVDVLVEKPGALPLGLASARCVLNSTGAFDAADANAERGVG